MEEAFYTCPHCWEQVSILVDVSVNGELKFVEDCEVCCNPNDFRVRVDHHQVITVEAEATQ